VLCSGHMKSRHQRDGISQNRSSGGVIKGTLYSQADNKMRSAKMSLTSFDPSTDARGKIGA
jgi:hypothetical protein